MLKSRGQFVGTVDATAIDYHHHLFVCGTKGVSHWVDVLTEFVGIKLGHEFIEDARGAVLHRPHDMEQHPTGDATPAAVALPGLAFETLLGVDLPLAQRAGGQTVALAAAPPAASGQGKAPQHGLILIEQDELALARPIC